jgi:hypothetical protein
MSDRPIRVYVAGPFRAEDCWRQERHVRTAEEAAWQLWKMGMAPLCPHSQTRFYQGSLPNDVWLEGDLSWVEVSQALYVVDGWEESEGTLGEIKLAKKLGIPIFFSMREIREHFGLSKLGVESTAEEDA